MFHTNPPLRIHAPNLAAKSIRAYSSNNSSVGFLADSKIGNVILFG